MRLADILSRSDDKAQEQAPVLSQTQERPARSGSGDALNEGRIAEMIDERVGGVENKLDQVLAALANNAQVAPAETTPAPAAQPVPDDAELVDVTGVAGSLTRHPDVGQYAGFANLEMGGYKQFLVEQDGRVYLNIAPIKQARAEASAESKGNAPAKSKARTSSRPTPSPRKSASNGTPSSFAELTQNKRFAKLRAFLSSNDNHAHWTGQYDVRFEAGGETYNMQVKFVDFPYNLRNYDGKYLPKTAKDCITAYCAPLLLDLPADQGGPRDAFSMALASAIGAKSNGDFTHAMTGHRYTDDWLNMVVEAAAS